MHALVHRSEGRCEGEFGTGFSNANYWWVDGRKGRAGTLPGQELDAPGRMHAHACSSSVHAHSHAHAHAAAHTGEGPHGAHALLTGWLVSAAGICCCCCCCCGGGIA